MTGALLALVLIGGLFGIFRAAKTDAEFRRQMDLLDPRLTDEDRAAGRTFQPGH